MVNDILQADSTNLKQCSEDGPRQTILAETVIGGDLSSSHLLVFEHREFCQQTLMVLKQTERDIPQF
jgi:hypothetical protein